MVALKSYDRFHGKIYFLWTLSGVRFVYNQDLDRYNNKEITVFVWVLYFIGVRIGETRETTDEIVPTNVGGIPILSCYYNDLFDTKIVIWKPRWPVVGLALLYLRVKKFSMLTWSLKVGGFMSPCLKQYVKPMPDSSLVVSFWCPIKIHMGNQWSIPVSAHLCTIILCP